MDLRDAGIHKVTQEEGNCLDLYCESNRCDCIIPDNHLLAPVRLILLVHVVRYFGSLFPASARTGEEK